MNAIKQWLKNLWKKLHPPPPPPPAKPVAKFEVATDGLKATFTDKSSVDPKLSGTVMFAFGDGTSSASMALGSVIAHIYQGAATYTIKQTVTDSAGQSATSTQNVTLKTNDPPPPPGDNPDKTSNQPGVVVV